MQLLHGFNILEVFAAGLVMASAGYLCFALICCLRWREAPARKLENGPSIAVFKPVCGVTDRLYDNLKSFCEQDYPDFEIIFGVATQDDPALGVIRKLIDEYSGLNMKVSIGCSATAKNPKIATVLPMAPLAENDLWVLADSDVRVRPDFLSVMAEEFNPDDVGAVTCLYTAVSRGNTTTKLGAMAINEWFLPSALVAKALGPLKYCFGAAMAVRRSVLDEIGGFQALADNLADDYMLGHLVHEKGYEVALARTLVETEVSEADMKSMVWREIRWGRTIRSMQPGGYFGSFLTYAIPLGLLGLVAFPTNLAMQLLLGTTLILRLAIHYAVRHFLGVRDPVTPWLLPVRDCLSFSIWLVSYVRRTVDWRGQLYRVERGGLMKSTGLR